MFESDLYNFDFVRPVEIAPFICVRPKTGTKNERLLE